MRSRKKSEPERIGGLIGPVLKEAEDSNHNPESLTIVANWREIAGNRLARWSRAVSLKDGKLFIETISPAWKQELLLRKNVILKKVYELLGKKTVSDMVINVRSFYVEKK